MATPDNNANVLVGTSAGETIHGLGGNDIINGAGGIDQLFGDAGNDTFLITGRWFDNGETYDGGTEIDTIDFSGVDYTDASHPAQLAYLVVDLGGGGSGSVVAPSGNIFGADTRVTQISITSVENVVGSRYTDIISGNGADNVINGGAGVDQLTGGGGNDTFLVTGDWRDNGETYDGGIGTDTIDFSGVDYTNPSFPNMQVLFGVDLAQGFAGSLVAPTGFFNGPGTETQATITSIENVVGSKYSDAIRGNELANTISGGDGADELDGRGGLDTILGGNGNDVIKVSGEYDTVGVDKIDGGNGVDTVNFSGLTMAAAGQPYARVDLATGAYSLGYLANLGFGAQSSSIGGVYNVENFIGAAGENWIAASAAANQITGGGADDTVSYEHSTAAVTIEGGGISGEYSVVRGGYAEGDVLKDIEFIIGSAFNDRLIGIENVTGGRGADTFSLFSDKILDFTASEGDVIEVPSIPGLFNVHGISELTWQWSASENLWLVGAANSPLEPKRVITPDRATPASAADRATFFTDEMFVFKPLVVAGDIAGNDSANNLVGTAAADTLIGFGGGDILTGNGGSDKMFGGDGNDRFVLNGAYHDGGEVIDGGRGVDTLDLSAVSYASLPGTIGSIQVDLAAQFIATNLTTPATGAWSATSSRVVGVENVIGSTGNDTITGDKNANVLDGRGGADKMAGGLGSDTYVTDGGDTITEAAGAGTDTVQSSVAYALGANLENLTLTGSSAINGTGNTLANVMTGNTAANMLNGAAGTDTLNGMLGNDTLTGGANADNFVFNTALNASTNRDTITDFAAEDTIRLENAIFTALTTTGTLKADAFWAAAGATTAHDTTDRVIYNTTTGALYYDKDGSGGAAAVQFATLSNHAALTNADFVVI
jgi:Ca2+-binding RTX toxin-like protein